MRAGGLYPRDRLDREWQTIRDSASTPSATSRSRRTARSSPRPACSATSSKQAVLADELGLDAFGVGEHHRRDFAISAPEVVLAAIAARTRRILLGSAVTVLSTDDPVRVFQRFSTLNALSNGRAEVILGRGSFTESYPLFGYDLSRYDELFEDKLALFAELLKGGPVTWSGSTRAAVSGVTIYPPIEHGTLQHLGRRRRKPGIRRPRRPLRPAVDARDHRRQPVALPAVRRSLSSGTREARPADAADRGPLAWPRRRDRRAGPRTSSGRTTKR